MHLVLIRDDLTMIYLAADFNQGTAQGVGFYSTVSGKHTLFMGPTRTLKAGVNMYDAFTVGTASKIGKANFGGLAGLIIPTDISRLCKGALGEV